MQEGHHPKTINPEKPVDEGEFILEGSTIVSALSTAVRAELSERQVAWFREAHRLRNFFPHEAPDEPEYDGDVKQFIAHGRQAYNSVSVSSENFRINPVHKSEDLSEQDAAIFDHFIRWRKGKVLTQIYPLIRQGVLLRHFADTPDHNAYRDTLAPFMIGTIKAVTSYSQVAATEQFRQARRDSLGVVVPATREAVRDRILQGKIGGATLMAAGRQLRYLPYSTQNRDFFALTTEQQHEIVDAIGEEFLVFVKYAARYGDPTILQRTEQPVMRRPATDLEIVMQASRNPQLDFYNYTHNVPAFDARLAEIAEQAERGEVPELTFDQKLLALQPGEVVQLTDVDETIRINDLRREVNDALDKLITALYATRYESAPNLEVNKGWRAENKDIVLRLVGKSNGRISNVRLQALDVVEHLQQAVSNWTDEATPAETARAFALLADIRSGSKKVPTAFEFLVYITKNSSGTSGRVIKSVRDRSTGDKVIKDEVERSKLAGPQGARYGIINKTTRPR